MPRATMATTRQAREIQFKPSCTGAGTPPKELSTTRAMKSHKNQGTRFSGETASFFSLISRCLRNMADTTNTTTASIDTRNSLMVTA